MQSLKKAIFFKEIAYVVLPIQETNQIKNKNLRMYSKSAIPLFNCLKIEVRYGPRETICHRNK